MSVVEEKWNEILRLVQKEAQISDIQFKTWLLPLEIVSFDGSTLQISNSDDHAADFLNYVKKKFEPFIVDAVYSVTGLSCEIKFVISPDTPDNNDNNVVSKNDNNNKNKAKYTFDTFVVGNNNRFAHSACLAVAESPGETYNPLFLYGGVGLGKTHLMKSVERFILDNYPDKKVIYTTSEVFTNELIEALRYGKDNAIINFRDKYRNIDVLLIDDIQFIIGKDATQEEFFHTFNALKENNSQIIISSDKPPKDFDNLEDRLKTRFEQGLIADIQAPDYETRMAILRNKEEMDGKFYPDEVIEYIATNIKSSIRELEGALNKLNAYSTLVKQEITLEIAEKELQNIIFPEKPKEVTIQIITNTVADHFHIELNDIFSQKRQSDIAFPRQIIMYLCRNMTNTPLQDIGKYLGNRDHTTIMHGVEKINKSIASNKETEELINTIKKKIIPN
ncbi:MAG: chromosomal replication initiator protein DnaA [Lachnospiraceae bacterium]|nr:chromosomal replication initiator protein DnaA [Lachnospiraceae bacterium]